MSISVHHTSKPVRSKALIVTMLLLASFSFLFPRETFDPHTGVDYDRYCRSYCSMNSDLQEAPVIIAGISLVITVAVHPEPVCQQISQRLARETRAPPM
ncbi:MAG: hypothetical protein JXA20_13245 [Spirochaetes bacterium]|nr:hypothetical protein [Spirochaetota bacterium]